MRSMSQEPSSTCAEPDEDIVGLDDDPLDDLSRRQHFVNQHRGLAGGERADVGLPLTPPCAVGVLSEPFGYHWNCSGKGRIFACRAGSSQESVVRLRTTRHGFPLKQRVTVVPSSSISATFDL